MIIDHYVTFDAGYTPDSASGVYAIIFNDNNQAINFSSLPFEFSSFSGPDQSAFVLPLEEHSERTLYYSAEVNEDNLNIPQGCYSIEIWCKEVTGGSFNRTVDKLIDVRTMYVTGEEYIAQDKEVFRSILESANRIPAEPASVSYECFLGVSWDHTLSRLSLSCFLERAGQLVTDPKSAIVTISTDEGTEIVNTSMGDPGATGEFFKTIEGLSLNPDRVYFASVSITDQNDVVHTSGSTTVTWD